MTELTFDGYIEYIETFTFREKAALTIPKRIREAAYAMQIDIEIVSTDGKDYLNTKSSPAYGFYGYAVLVMRDHSEIQIPISQPRQVLYYGRVPEAFANWYSLYLSAVALQTQLAIAEGLIVPIGVELGLSVAAQPLFCPTFPPWQELPIREVYVKSKFGTQFKIETTWTEPLPVAYGECSYDGKSGSTDSDKDDGLPSDGTQPQNNGNPSDPYGGFPPANSAEELGDFFNPKQGGLDNPREANAPEEPEEPPLEYQYCNVTVTVRTNEGVLQETFNATNVVIPVGDFLIVEQYTDPSNAIDGVSDAVKLNVAGLYWNGATFSTERIRWSQNNVTISAVCQLEPFV